MIVYRVVGSGGKWWTLKFTESGALAEARRVAERNPGESPPRVQRGNLTQARQVVWEEVEK